MLIALRSGPASRSKHHSRLVDNHELLLVHGSSSS